MRACKLKNIATGKVISAKSIAAFCKKVGLIGNERYHLTPVLDGERVHHKGWTTPEKYAELYKAREWKDIYGKREKCKGMTFNSIETEQKSIV
jgi:hypothetical protein